MRKLKEIVKKILFIIFSRFTFLRNLVRGVLDVFAKISVQTSKWVGNVYTLLFDYLGTSWYDHRYDYLRGIQNYHWLERVFFVLPKISKNDSVLDVGSGDGIFSGLFYSDKAKDVLAVDMDQNAVDVAKRRYKKDNVKFLRKNVSTWEIPKNRFDIVIMFSVIEHLTADNGQRVLKNIQKSLKKNGIFYGSTPIVNKLGVSNWEHKNEFTSQEQLKIFLENVFDKVKISSSSWNNERPEGYFECRK